MKLLSNREALTFCREKFGHALAMNYLMEDAYDGIPFRVNCIELDGHGNVLGRQSPTRYLYYRDWANRKARAAKRVTLRRVRRMHLPTVMIDRGPRQLADNNAGED
jgi:hypothetical protein